MTFLMNSEEAIKSLNILIGKKVQSICRTCDLIDIGFGELVYKYNARGKEIVVPTYALHLQCPFRISNANGIITGSDDLFVSSSEIENAVDLSKKNVCVLDYQLARNESIIKNGIVNNIEISKYGDLNIYLSDYVISIFPASSTDGESWRFFRTGKEDKHLIRKGKSFEIQ